MSTDQTNHIIQKTEVMLNILELLCILLMLFMAFIFQIILHEIPCPLCILQRVGFIGIVFGLLLNIRFGLRPSHYSITLISALFTAFVALRQIALHIVPGTGAYGLPFLGLHLYTWVFIVSMIIIVATTLMLSVDRQYKEMLNNKISLNYRHPMVMHVLFFITALLIAFNIISVVLECGFHPCPSNPTKYLVKQ